MQGAFFGRSGGVAGFSISSEVQRYLRRLAVRVALNNVRLYTGSAGSAAEFPNPGTLLLIFVNFRRSQSSLYGRLAVVI